MWSHAAAGHTCPFPIANGLFYLTLIRLWGAGGGHESLKAAWCEEARNRARRLGQVSAWMAPISYGKLPEAVSQEVTRFHGRSGDLR